MRETGVVRKIVDGRAYVLVKRGPQACCMGCTLCSQKDGVTAEIVLEAPSGLQPQDEVTIEIPAASPLRASVLLFLIPMLLLVGVTIAGQSLFSPGAQGQVSLPAVGLGLAAMFLWYGAVLLLDRRSRGRRTGAPRIVEHHPGAGAAGPGV